MINETVILIAIHTSRTAVGIGKIRIARIPTSAIGMNKLLTLIPLSAVLVVVAVAISYCSLLCNLWPTTLALLSINIRQYFRYCPEEVTWNLTTYLS